MKKLITTLLLLVFLSNYILGQSPTNANRYNYTVFSTGYYYKPDTKNGTNYPTFLLRSEIDGTVSSPGALLGTRGENAEHSRYWDADTPSRKESGWRQILRALNTSQSYYDYETVAYDNTCGDRTTWNSYCFPASSDGTTYSMNNRLYGRYGETGSYYNTWQRVSNIEVRFHSTWRYYNGEGQGRPLTFGTIPSGGYRTHTNFNRAAPSNIARDGFKDAGELGYVNNWSSTANAAFSNSPDVTYSFTIDELSTVDINTNYSSTNYNSRLHIVKDGAGSSWELLESNDAANSSTNKARITRVLEPGNYFIVVEGDGTATGKFYLRVDVDTESLTAGNISHPMPWVNAGCKLTIPVGGEEATSSFAPVFYDWHILRTDPDPNDNIFYVNDFLEDAGPTLEPDEAGPIDVETKFVRIARSENILRRALDTITIEPLAFNAIGNDGIIKGRVTGRDGSSGVAGIIVHAYPGDNVHGNCQVYSDTTDFNGFYEITNIYYGYNGNDPDIPNAEYIIKPEFEDHIFDPDSLIVQNLQQSARIKNNIDFRDITTFFIRGRVTQSDANSNPTDVCGVPGVRMYLKETESAAGEISLWQTDTDGYYSIAVQNQGKHTVRPDYLNHGFSPMISDTLNVIENIEDIDFTDTSRHTISGSVLACGGFIFGSVELAIEDTLGCFKFRKRTDASGNFEIEVPAGAYNVNITEEPIVGPADNYRIEDVIAFFNRPILVNVSEENASLNMIYRQKPIINVQGIPVNTCGDYVMDQLQEYDLYIEITETNTGGCPLDTGSVIIIDNVSDREQITLPISNGIVQYRVKAADPNFVGDFKKLFQVTARHLQDTTFETTTNDYRIVVTGAKQREATFTTVSPEVPFFILRDPPGDGSYSYLAEESSSQVSLGFSYMKGGSVNLWQKARLGTTFEAGVLGFSTETDVWGEIGSSTTVTASSRLTTEGILTFNNGARYETSSDPDPDLMGKGGDLYVGAAMSLRYAKADILDYDDSACMPVKGVDLIMGDADLQTKFVYTEFNIRNSIIPSLESLRDEQETDADRMYYQDQIDVWNQTLALNQTQKDNAAANTAFPINGDPGESSISWSGGTNQEYFSTTTAEAKASIEFNLEIEKELSAELGINVGGSGRSGGGYIRTRMEIGGSIGGALLSSRTTGFVLTDDDNLDRFETTVLKDPVYNTPVFRNDAAITSCPYEPGTSPIDGPVLEALIPIATNVPPDGNAGFRFRISNNSQDEKTRSYYLDMVDDSNPDGANINASLPILFSNLDYGESRERFISVSRDGADPSVFSYEGLEFILYPAECAANGEYATSTARVSAYFNSTCSNVTMMEPQQGWYSNYEDNNIRRVWIKDYVEAELSDITIQYTEAGKDSWNVAEGPLTADDLNDNGTNGTFVDWNVTSIPDGEYDIRLKLTCGFNTTYTGRVRGVIDRIAPEILGIPNPIDDDYDPQAGDDLSVRMIEDVVCSNATLQLKDLETEEFIEANMTCQGNEIQVVPIPLLENRTPSVYRITVSNLEDAVGNIADDINWVFKVGDYIYDPDCSPVMISNNNENQDAISQSVYYSEEIRSDGTINESSSIGYRAENSITLEPGFEVMSGGQLTAEIETCEND